MKAKKKNSPPKRATAARPSRRKRERNWTPVYVGLQIVLVAAALAAITRCSPLAPSANLHGAAAKPAGITGGHSENAATAAAEQAAREDLLKLIDQSSITVATDVNLFEDEKRIERNAGALSSITLLNSERDKLINGEQVTLSLLTTLRGMNLTKEQIQKEFKAVGAVAPNRRVLTIRMHIEKRGGHRPQTDTTSTAYGRLVVGEIDGLMRIWVDKSRQAKLVADLAAARRIDVEIHSQ